LKEAYAAPKWFEVEDDTVLYHIYKKPKMFEDLHAIVYGEDKQAVADKLLIHQLTELLIPVTFKPQLHEPNHVPTTVQVNLKYNQKTNTNKELVKAEVLLLDYSNAYDLIFGDPCNVTEDNFDQCKSCKDTQCHKSWMKNSETDI